MAEAVFRHHTKASDLVSNIDSCGTGAWHLDAAPDRRTLAVLAKHQMADGFEHRARKIRADDLFAFDWILGMDADNLDDLRRWRGRALRKGAEDDGRAERRRVARLGLFGDFGTKDRSGRGEEVVDPYYGADDGFEVAFEQMTRFTGGFLQHLQMERERGREGET